MGKGESLKAFAVYKNERREHALGVVLMSAGIRGRSDFLVYKFLRFKELLR